MIKNKLFIKLKNIEQYLIYLSMQNKKETTLLNKKTNLVHDIQNDEDLNPNILNSNTKTNKENFNKNKEKNKKNHLRDEHINIKKDIKNLNNEIDNNYKFNEFMSDFNNDKIKETQKELDNNDNKINMNEDIICCVCYEIASNNPNLNYSISKCNHSLCNICWSKTLYEKLECPICRKKARVKTLKRIIRTNIDLIDNTNSNDKIK